MDKTIFLSNTDTTIGFISKSKDSLDRAKSRVANKEYITALPNLNSLKKRTPKKFNKTIRRAKNSTFILNKSYSFRIIKEKKHLLLISRLKYAYTTSANKSTQEFNLEFAKSVSDIIVYPLNKLEKPSKIYKLGKSKIIRVR